ncbi:MAG: DNA-binding protein [Bradyrhizobium sp.]|nr:DNA-binding protein [Bradyrhizobium sp.]
MIKDDAEFSTDLMRGAEEIAHFLFGTESARRKVYHLIATTKFPHFKLGSMICARKSVVIQWIEIQELRHANDNSKLDTKFVRFGNVQN